jgi:hypothetical protein
MKIKANCLAGAILFQVLRGVKMQDLAILKAFSGIFPQALKLQVKKSIDLFSLSR